MTYYTCKDCGHRVMSKCVRQRSIFPAGDPGEIDKLEGFYSNFLQRKIVVEYWPEDDPKVPGIVRAKAVQISMIEYGSAEVSDEQLYKDAIKMIKEMPQENVGMWICDHDYIPDSVCMFGCCKPKYDPLNGFTDAEIEALAKVKPHAKSLALDEET